MGCWTGYARTLLDTGMVGAANIHGLQPTDDPDRVVDRVDQAWHAQPRSRRGSAATGG